MGVRLQDIALKRPPPGVGIASRESGAVSIRSGFFWQSPDCLKAEA